MRQKWTWSEATARFPGCCPWAIGTQKDNFLSFAVRIAAAVPGALVYETPKTWSVSKPGKELVKIDELLNASASVREAVEQLHLTLMNAAISD